MTQTISRLVTENEKTTRPETHTENARSREEDTVRTRLTPLKTDDSPRTCTPKTRNSTLKPQWKSEQTNDGYNVQPKPMPSSTTELTKTNENPRKYNHKETQLNRGKAMSQTETKTGMK